MFQKMIVNFFIFVEFQIVNQKYDIKQCFLLAWRNVDKVKKCKQNIVKLIVKLLFDFIEYCLFHLWITWKKSSLVQLRCSVLGDFAIPKSDGIFYLKNFQSFVNFTNFFSIVFLIAIQMLSFLLSVFDNFVICLFL